jgi:hypothetical protein
VRLARRALVAVAAASLLSSAACANQQFTADHRIHFTSPKAGAKTTTPVHVTWTYHGFTPTGFDGQRNKTEGQFALFLDTSPIKAGQRLTKIIKKDAACLGKEKTCLDANALSDHYVFLSTGTSMEFDTLPHVSASGKTETHELILVLVDGQGYRIGESAWHVTFRVKKRSF